MLKRFLSARAAMSLLFVVLAIGVLGCKGGKPKGTVKGTVTYNGEPVKSGSINFISVSGAADMVKLDETGTYKLNGPIDAGKFLVYILPPIPEQLPPGKKPPAPPAKFLVPLKYQAPETSGISVEVKEGENTIPIDIK